MGRKARIAGRLTLKGVTKAVILDANLVGAGVIAGKRTVSFEANTTIRRSSFGVSAALPLVPDMIPLDIIVVFERPEGNPRRLGS
jgi:polyisoprenoid-binding protein YceI